MKRFKYFACVIALAVSATASADDDLPPQEAPTSGLITFSDDFQTFNRSRWSTSYPWGDHYTPGQEQFYLDPEPTASHLSTTGAGPFIANGDTLTIRADRASSELAKHLNGQRFVSGLITTYYSFAQLYGYFEMRARLPRGKGLWPAFWLLPTDLSWPPEIDVFEVLGAEPNNLHVTVHCAAARDVGLSFAIEVPDLTTSFHRYGVLWSPHYVAWYFDGTRVAFVSTPVDMRTKRMYMLINLAVGGWSGHPDANTRFPADMEIEFVRAYALAGLGE